MQLVACYIILITNCYKMQEITYYENKTHLTSNKLHVKDNIGYFPKAVVMLS